MMCVVGSGPSGATTAHMLLRAGFDVTMLDAGLTLEPSLERNVDDYLADRDSARFLGSIEQARSANARDERTLPDKLRFGSNFVNREVEEHILGAVEDAEIQASLALGGLSNIWGSAVLPVTARDIDDWPITADQLAPHYRALDEIVEISREPDGLDACFGDGPGARPTFPLGRQGAAVLADLAPHQAALAARGIHFGRARLAVGGKHSVSDSGCVSCGLCMQGCPYRAIFNSASVIEALRRQERFTYRDNLVVERVVENQERTTVVARDLRDGTAYSQDFERVFIGAGAVATTTIIARSLGLEGSPLRFRDSQHFIFPIFRFQRVSGALTEDANRLAQLFVEIDRPDVCHRLVHMQLYGYNDLVLVDMKRRLGRVFDLVPAAVRHLLERTIIVQGFLHSDVSGSVRFELPESRDGRVSLPRLIGEPNSHSREVIRRALGSLRAHWRKFRALPMTSPLLIPPPGSSHHFGGSLPMRLSPGRGETDLLGRPGGLTRVHAVDSTILPSVPATTITYTVMANAARIVTEVARNFGSGAA